LIEALVIRMKFRIEMKAAFRAMSRVIWLLMAVLMTPGSAAEEVSHEQFKQLDGQVQNIKKDVLEISSGLIQFEEKYIYPQDSRISIFMAMNQEDEPSFDTVSIKIDGKPSATHKYLPKELAAMQRGGVHRVYTGNIGNGDHALEVTASVTQHGSKERKRSIVNYKFSKNPGAKNIEINLATLDYSDPNLSLKE